MTPFTGLSGASDAPGLTDPTIAAAVRRGLLDRLLADQPTAMAAHVVAILALAGLLWNDVSHGVVAAWAIAVLLTTGVRALAIQRVPSRIFGPLELRVRVALAAVGLAWGVGTAALGGAIPDAHLALVIGVLGTLVAGAVGTLEADRVAFGLYALGALGPITLRSVLLGSDRLHLIAAVLLTSFVFFMLVLNGRTYNELLERLRTAALLARSEREASRGRAYLEALLAKAPIAVAVTDGDHRIVSVNPRFETLFGYSAPEAVGRELDDLIVAPERRGESRALQARAERGEAVAVEVERHRKDGTPLQAWASVAALGAQPEDGVVMLYEDVTERKRAEVAMAEARAAAERAAHARSAFLANMSHEIRTPMNAVLGMVELVLDTDLATEQRRALELVRSSAEALLSVLNDILDYSKIEAEHLELETIQFDLPKLVHSTVSLLAVRARSQHLELIADVGRDVPALVRGDPTRLRQVLTNLIGNAIKFTEAGEVAVTVAVADAARGTARIRFSVRDTGIGIAPDQLHTIFQEFQQADDSMSRRYGGTGLGLAISRRLVGLMGGELRVTSEVGKGSEFTFALPFPVELAAAPRSRLHEQLRPRSHRVLVVDDNETNRRIVRDMLAGEGMVVGEAAHADAGLAALGQALRAGDPYDLAVIDAQMPDRDGFALASAVRAQPTLAATRLCMLTSAGQRGDGERCRELGIQGYLTKPIARADLLEAVAMVLADRVQPERSREVVTRHTMREARRELHVLLAEDNDVNQQVAVALLVRRGHFVDVVANGREAVGAIQRRRYDVVLMDIQMPEMDGFAATAAIRRLPEGRDLPIYALTAHAVSGERERCLAHGMNGYLAKPFKGRELYALVEQGAPAAAESRGSLAPGDGVVNVAAFRALMRDAGAEAAVDGILDTFVRQAAERVGALAGAIEAQDRTAIARAAHAFKSAALSIHATGLGTLLERIEQAARRGDLAEARAQLDRMRAAAAAVVDALSAARSGGATPGET